MPFPGADIPYLTRALLENLKLLPILRWPLVSERMSSWTWSDGRWQSHPEFLETSFIWPQRRKSELRHEYAWKCRVDLIRAVVGGFDGAGLRCGI